MTTPTKIHAAGRIRRSVRSCALLAAGLLLLGGCFSPFDSLAGTTGTLTLSLGDSDLRTNTILPEPTNPATLTYTVALTRAGYDDIVLADQTAVNITVESVAVGVWSIDVVGFNGGAPAFRSEPGLEISVDAGANFFSVPLFAGTDGSGNISVDVSWPAGLIDDYDAANSVFGEYGGVPAPLDAGNTTIVGTTLTFEQTGIPSGSYVLRLYLDNAAGTRVASVIRIINVFDTLTSSDIIVLAADEIASPPVAPSGLSVELTGDTEFALTWTNEANTAEGYNIYRDALGGVPEAVLGPNDSSYQASSAAGIEVTYFVTAFNDFGESAAETVGVTPIALPAEVFPAGTPGAPADVSPSVWLDWQAFIGFDNYRLYISTDQAQVDALDPAAVVSYPALPGIDSTLTDFLAPAPGQIYFWTVEAENASGAISLPTQAFVVWEPLNLEATLLVDQVENSVRLDWNELPGADGYEYEYSPDPDFLVNVENFVDDTLVAPTVELGALPPATTLYFRIRGFDAYGNGEWSQTAEATTTEAFVSEYLTGAASGWFGGDANVGNERNVGVGFGITMPASTVVNEAGYVFGGIYSDSGDALPAQMTMVVHMRDGAGNIAQTVTRLFAAGDWQAGQLFVVGGFDELALAGETYIFTFYIEDAHLTPYPRAGGSGDADNNGPMEAFRVTGTGNAGNLFDLDSWASWNTHAWDPNYFVGGSELRL